MHSKLLIADDRLVILGSANLNSRSQFGDRDSEIAAIITGGDKVVTRMGGRPWRATVFAHTLRRNLMEEHLGLAHNCAHFSLAGGSGSTTRREAVLGGLPPGTPSPPATRVGIGGGSPATPRHAGLGQRAARVDNAHVPFVPLRLVAPQPQHFAAAAKSAATSKGGAATGRGASSASQPPPSPVGTGDGSTASKAARPALAGVEGGGGGDLPTVTLAGSEPLQTATATSSAPTSGDTSAAAAPLSAYAASETPSAFAAGGTAAEDAASGAAAARGRGRVLSLATTHMLPAETGPAMIATAETTRGGALVAESATLVSHLATFGPDGPAPSASPAAAAPRSSPALAAAAQPSSSEYEPLGSGVQFQPLPAAAAAAAEAAPPTTPAGAAEGAAWSAHAPTLGEALAAADGVLTAVAALQQGAGGDGCACDAFLDPLDDRFYRGVWLAAAASNTRIFDATFADIMKDETTVRAQGQLRGGAGCDTAVAGVEGSHKRIAPLYPSRAPAACTQTMDAWLATDGKEPRRTELLAAVIGHLTLWPKRFLVRHTTTAAWAGRVGAAPPPILFLTRACLAYAAGGRGAGHAAHREGALPTVARDAVGAAWRARWTTRRGTGRRVR